MTVRPLRSSDIPVLSQMAADSGFPYPDLASPAIEAVRVVVNERDEPIMALAAERLVQGYLYVRKDDPAGVKLAAMHMLYQEMPKALAPLHYNGLECFICPDLAHRFGRFLKKRFGFVTNWPSFAWRF